MGVAVGAKTVQPHQPSAKGELILLIFTGEQIDEFRRASFHGAAGFVVLGDNRVAKRGERVVLVWRKIFWDVLSGWRCRFFTVNHLVSIFRGFCRDDLQD